MFSFANWNTSAWPGSLFSQWAIFRARSGLALPVVDLELIRVHGCLPLAEGGHDERPGPLSVRSAIVRLGVVIVAHATALRQPGAERGDARRPGPRRRGASRSRRARSASSG